MNDPFSILGLEPRFDLDQADLHRRFLHASAANHPDRFTDPDEQADAADRAASINAAYAQLSNPQGRAMALIALLGAGTPVNKESDNALPAGFLPEMMEVRERLDEAIEADDRATLRELSEWVAAQREEKLAQLASLFAQIAGPGTAAGDRVRLLAAVRLELNVLRYFDRMIEQMPAA